MSYDGEADERDGRFSMTWEIVIIDVDTRAGLRYD